MHSTPCRPSSHAIPLAIVAAASIAAGCSRISGALDSESTSKETLSRAFADTSKAVGAAASDVASKLGLNAAASKPAQRAAAAAPAPPATAPAKPAARRTSSRAGTAVPPTTLPVIPVEIVPDEPEIVPAPLQARTAIVPVSNASMRPAAVSAPLPSTEIYSDADPDVVPARLLEKQTGGPVLRGVQADMNTMELVISPQGRVEQVRLMSVTKRMTDMLLLSGAKTWKFAPALRNGQPVRYRTLVSWEGIP